MVNNIENIDRYFRGEMSTGEMQQFESIVTQDPILEKEFSFQQELVESIQAVRKAELKTRLSNVDVTGVATFKSSAITKVLGGLAAVGVVAIGSYFYFGEEKIQTITDDNTTALEVVESEVEEQESINDPIIIEEISEESSEASPMIEVEQVTSSQETVVSEKATNIKEEPVIVISEANVTEGFEDEIEVSETEAPVNHMIEKSKVAHSTLEVVIEVSKRYSFHYQVRKNTLALYGNFTNLYEIIEFHKDGNISTYLKYDEKYYAIDKLQSKVTPLIEMTGDGLLNLLDNIENNKER